MYFTLSVNKCCIANSEILLNFNFFSSDKLTTKETRRKMESGDNFIAKKRSKNQSFK